MTEPTQESSNIMVLTFNSSQIKHLVDALQEVTRYIIGYYNQLRPYQHNGGLTPNKSEKLYWENSKTVAKFS